MDRHREEPTGLAFGEPDGKLLDKAIQCHRFGLCPGCFASLAMTTCLITDCDSTLISIIMHNMVMSRPQNSR
jgi:hypothetical protein